MAYTPIMDVARHRVVMQGVYMPNNDKGTFQIGPCFLLTWRPLLFVVHRYETKLRPMPQCHILKKCTHKTEPNSKRQCVKLLQMLRLFWGDVKTWQSFGANVTSVPGWWNSVNIGSIFQFPKFLTVSIFKMKWFQQAQTYTDLRVGQNCPIFSSCTSKIIVHKLRDPRSSS